MAIYDIKNLTFTFKGQEHPVLSSIDLTIEEGGFYIICGKSGSGKSTLLKLLKKEISPNGSVQGEILYNGVNINSLDGRISASEIGYLGQDIESSLVCDKVWKELAFGLGNLGFNDKYIAGRVAEVSEYFGISKWYESKISELSGGSKQIVALASIMTMNPKVLLLDEPTSMLDPIAKKNFINLLGSINRDFGITIILVEHNMEGVFDLANQIIVMDSGKVRSVEKPYNLAAELSTKEYSKHIGLPEFAEIYARLGGKGEMPKDIKEKRSWLELQLAETTQKNQNIQSKIDTKLQIFNDNDMDIRKKSKDNNAVLVADNLYFRYSKKGADIVKGVNLELSKGEIVCVLGGNGTGKTTFINLLTGISKPYHGKIKVDKNLNISLLPQNAKGLFVENSVKEELLTTSKLLGVDKNVAEKLMDEFELNDIGNNHPYDISGGEVQRLALAKLFLTNPDIIILDEPTQGMDMGAKEYLNNKLKEKTLEGKSVIVVTHDLRFAQEVADRVGMFFDGKILSLSNAEEFFASNNLYTTESSLLTRGFVDNFYSVSKIVAFVKN